MPATPEVLKGRSSARRVVLAAPVDDLALTFEDVASMVLDDLDANDGGSTFGRVGLATVVTALRETLT